MKKKLIGVILMLVALVCIVWTVVEVIRGKAPLWSTRVIGAFIFHALVMLGAVWLLEAQTRGPRPSETAEGGA